MSIYDCFYCVVFVLLMFNLSIYCYWFKQEKAPGHNTLRLDNIDFSNLELVMPRELAEVLIALF